MLHTRTEAYDATGDANKRKCRICKEFDDVSNLAHRKCGNVEHNSCVAKYVAHRRKLKMAIKAPSETLTEMQRAITGHVETP